MPLSFSHLITNAVIVFALHPFYNDRVDRYDNTLLPTSTDDAALSRDGHVYIDSDVSKYAAYSGYLSGGEAPPNDAGFPRASSTCACQVLGATMLLRPT